MAIDLGIQPRTELPAVTLTCDELQVLLDLLELTELPVVVAAPSDQAVGVDLLSARATARRELGTRGLVDDADEVHPDLARWLRAVSRPQWVLAMRICAASEVVTRLCVASAGDVCCHAELAGRRYRVAGVDGDPWQPVLAALGPSQPLNLATINAATEQLVSIFDDAARPETTTRRMAALGVATEPAATLARALAGCMRHSQVIGIRYGDGVRSQLPQHLAVFDTEAGRFLATAAPAADGRAWSTLTGGDERRLRQALRELVTELGVNPPDRREPS